MKRLFTSLCSVLLLFSIIHAPKATACSRLLYVGNDTLRLVGRSLDWRTPIPTNLYVYPAGLQKRGHSLPGAVEWRSKYGAVYAVGYDGGITEGMNEKGLVVNGLFCKGTVYGNEQTKQRPPMSLAMFVAWILDLNATTPEAVAMLKAHNFNITGATFDSGTVSALHWGITDAQGNSAIVEFVDGNINIYEEHDLTMLTNDPPYPQMEAIVDYWSQVNGQQFLPGTVKSPDRFVRGHYFAGNVERTSDPDLGFAICRSLLMNLSVPYKYEVAGEANLSSTQWRSFSDIRSLRYYFDIVTNMGVFYIDLSKCNLNPGAPIMKLDTSKSTDYIGIANKHMYKSDGFKPMY